MACQSTSALGYSLSTFMQHCSSAVPLIIAAAMPPCRGLLGTVRTVAQEEGPKALWNGLEAGAAAHWPCQISTAVHGPATGLSSPPAQSRAVTGPTSVVLAVWTSCPIQHFRWPGHNLPFCGGALCRQATY